MLQMKTIYEIRLDNLRALVEKAGGLSALIENAAVKLSRPTLDQLLKKRTTAAGTVKGIGDDLARKIETALRLERGWMDSDQLARQPRAGDDGKPDIDELIEVIALYGSLPKDLREAARSDLSGLKDLAETRARVGVLDQTK